ncbi:Ig-like domain-containing protein [Saccharicrinis aurantiacus]|uniref:Ig-like domain-containing protein n=1 Tax=Saccharicrinis aurantiacus TaxID=1849719 RepID=UPI00248FC7E1|nr:Ig-like domain-containing protein [Saccharicrinis aurantiacus]
MNIKTYLKILVALLILFVSESAWGQWDGLDPAFSPTIGMTDVEINPIIILDFNGANIIEFEKEQTIYVTNEAWTSTFSFFTGKDGAPGFPPNPEIPMDPRVTISGSKVFINLSDDLLLNSTEYIVYIGPNTLKVDGTYYNALSNPNKWRFTTASLLPPPTITSYNPTPNSSGVIIDQNLQIVFNEEIKKGSSGRIFIRHIDDGSEHNSFGTDNNAVVASGNTVTISNSNLNYNTGYYVEIDDGYILNTSDVAFPGFSGASDWYFTTETLMPTATFNPDDKSDGISIQSIITITYSEAMVKTNDSELVDSDLAGLISLAYGGSSIPFSATVSTDKTTITITPNSNLPEFETITTTIASLKGEVGGGETGILSSFFVTDGLITWNGSVSRDITDDANWSGTFVEGISVHIPVSNNNPVVPSGSSHYVRNLTIDAGASLTIDAGATVTVGKYLELRSSNNTTIGNASLLVNGTLDTDLADVVVHQMVERGSVALYISSPMQSSTLADATEIRSAYAYNSPSANWSLLTTNDTFDPGIGYFVYSNEGEITFKGDLNQGDQAPIPTYRTTSPNNYGWNLIGNPYPCSIDWNLVDKTNMKDQFYIMKRDNQSYGVYNAGGGSQVNLNPINPSHIPSCHAFWTQVEIGEPNGTLTFTEASKVDSHYSYLKTVNSNTQKEIRFSGLNSNNIEDELLIAFNENSDDLFDNYDSERRMASNDELLQLYTIHSNKQLVIDTYNNLNDSKTIQLGFKVGKAGTYKIKLKNLVNIEDDISIELEDIIDGSTTQMNKNSEYTFETASGSFNNRFRINLSSTSTDIDNGKKDADISVYNVNDNIYIKIPDLNNPHYKIYDVSGALVSSGRLNSNENNIIKSKSSGLVIVKIISNDYAYNKKIIIKK